LIERIEGAPLGDVLKRRIFDPLGMKDTGVHRCAEDYGRRAGLNGFNAEGQLTTLHRFPVGMRSPSVLRA